MNFIAHIRPDGQTQSCKEHCVAVARGVHDRLYDTGLNVTGYLSGLLHDCGKFTKEFQSYIIKATNGEPVEKGSVIHSFAGVSFILKRYHGSSNEISRITSEIIAFAIGSHHGLFDGYDESGLSGFEHRLSLQPEYDERAIQSFLNECDDDIDSLFEQATHEIEAKIVQFKTMCGSHQRKRQDLFLLLGFLVRTITSALIDADRNDTASFMRNKETAPDTQQNWSRPLYSINEYLDRFSCQTDIERARRSLSSLCAAAGEKKERVYKLSLPTGAGKTLSGMRYALEHARIYKKRRIYYIAPLISIIEQNADVIRNAVGDPSIVLEHHSDVVNEDRSNEYERRYDELTETWDAPIVITTLVQFLNTAFLGKTSSVRRFQALNHSVIILDEVQSVPTKMLTLFNAVVDYLSTVCHATVVLCSATQPTFDATPYPLVAENLVDPKKIQPYETVFRRNIVSHRGQYKLDELPQLVKELLGSYQSVLVVCNKKSEASELFDYVSEMGRCYHLSAGMCMAHRKSMLSSLENDLRSGKKVVCVSTQVIEAGIDISFDAAIRLSAGMDNIVQTAGRCNRNGHNAPDAPVWIVDCVNESLQVLTDISAAKAATAALCDAIKRNGDSLGNDLTSDCSIDWYYRKLFTGKPNGFFDYRLEQSSIYELLSDNRQHVRSNHFFLNQAFACAGKEFRALDTVQFSVVVPWEEGSEVIDQLYRAGENISKKMLDKAKPYTVAVYDYQMQKLLKAQAVYTIGDGLLYILSPEYYDKHKGIKMEGDNKCLIL